MEERTANNETLIKTQLCGLVLGIIRRNQLAY